MAKRLINKKHLMIVSQLPCFITKAGFCSHSDGVQAHHLLRPSTGPRQGVKAGDNEVIPLCFYHHSLLHTKHGTEKNFFKYYGMKEDAGIKYAKQLYAGNQNWVDYEDDLPF
jgi:hypothetical protein